MRGPQSQRQSLRHVAEKGLNDGLFERPRGELLADPSPIISSVAHLQRCENPPCEATHNNNTPHRSAAAHTPTCRSKKLASTPPELASRRCPRSRGAVTSIGDLRQGRASCGPLGCRPRRRRAHARPSWKVAAGTSAIFLESGSAAQRLGASTRARAHIPGTALNSRGGRQRPAHAAEHPGPLHLRLH